MQPACANASSWLRIISGSWRQDADAHFQSGKSNRSHGVQLCDQFSSRILRGAQSQSDPEFEGLTIGEDLEIGISQAEMANLEIDF
jgi:hypothetical protein